MYTIIRKRHVFHALANLPSDVQGISKCLNNRKLGIVCNPTVNRIKTPTTTTSTTSENMEYRDESPPPVATKPLPVAVAVAAVAAATVEDEDTPSLENRSDIEESMEGSRPAQPAEPGTLKASLLDTPAIATMTESESAHPLQTPLCDFSPMNEHCDSTIVQDIPNAEQSAQPLTRKSEPETPAPLKRSVNQVHLTKAFSFG